MLMHIKGHNSLSLCQMCTIKGIWMPNLWNKMLYMPLSCHNHPEPTNVDKYDLGNLLLYKHNSFLAQAKSLQDAHTDKDCEELIKAYSIKSVPLLSALTSLRFPGCFHMTSCIWSKKTSSQILYSSGLVASKESMRGNNMS
jgi:hypothetical protein